MNGPARRQRGVTLLISLVMLTILTVFAAAMIRLSSTNMLIAGNMAAQHSLRDAVQRAIEADINSTSFYTDVAASTGCWKTGLKSNTFGSTSSTTPCFAGVNTNGYNITLNIPVCLKYLPAAGYSALDTNGNGIEDTYWEVSATGVDPISGASVTITQGVKITMPAGNCNGA